MNPHIDDKDTNQDKEIMKEDSDNYTFDIVSMYPTVLDSENEIKQHDIVTLYNIVLNNMILDSENEIKQHDTCSYNMNGS